MRMVAVRIGRNGAGIGQLPLLPSVGPPLRPAALPVLDQRLRGTKFVTLEPRSVLNSPEQTGMDFWSLNPYVGCEFGCTYCYARYTHRYVVERAHDAGKLSDREFSEYRGAHGWEAFEQRIFVKQQIQDALEHDLRRYFRRPEANGASDAIVIGTATDPYQPAERRFKITRAVLARLARCEGLSIGLITKSPLVTRDTDLFTEIQRRNDLEIHLSLMTLDVALIRRLEVRSPMPAVRLRALERLTTAGVNAGLIVAPVLPGITDAVERLDALFQAARRAGARFLSASPLRLYPGIRDRFLPVLDEHFPELSERYRRAYADRGVAPRAYAKALARRVKNLQLKHGFASRDMRDRYQRRQARSQRELDLTVPLSP
jgi:DNA repair photolyase